MIPNKHLETPHYKLERLRHDDPRLDDQKASYVMAEEAARELETDTTVSKKDADVKVRPEAAVKGITPNAPAPVSQPRPARGEPAKAESSGGFFGFIKSLFSSSTPEPKPEPVAPRGRNQGRNGDRNNRNGNRGRRGERAERPAVAATEGATTEGGNRNRNSRNGNRNQNGPKQERTDTPRNQAAVTPATEATPNGEAIPSAEGDEQRRGRGRNRRGRGRGQREHTDANGEAVIASVVAVTTSFTGPPVGMAGVSATMPTKDLAHSFGNNKPAANEPKERSERAPRGERTPRAPRPAQVTTPAPVAAPAIEVIAKPMPELPKVAFQALEETPLHSVVQSAGMIWVATDSSKHAEAQSQIKAEPVASNLGRAPKPAASLPDGPMVLVETGGQEKAV